jgi:hypothetical protein
MMDQSNRESLDYQPARFQEPFEISWFDRFSSAIDTLRPPYWLLTTFIVVFTLGTSYIISKLQASPFEWSFTLLYSYLQILYFLLTLRHLGLFATRSLERTRRAMRINDEQFERLQMRFANTPRNQARWGTLIGAGFAILIAIGTLFVPEVTAQFSTVEVSLTPVGVVTELILLSIWILNGFLVAFIVHKLRMIDVIYTQWTDVNPFQPRALYSLANYSGRTAILWVLPSIPWIILDPGLFSLVTAILFSILGLLIYILPLMGVHRLLEQAKADLLDQNGAQVKSTIEDMNHHLQSQHLEDFASLDSVLSGLERSRTAIDRISTWPWQVDSFRRVIVALLLPLLIWLAQFFLGRLLGI